MSDQLPITVIGLGNEFRGDDAVGLIIAGRIREKKLPDVRVIEGVSDGTTLIEIWGRSRAAILVDCVSSGAEAGKIHRFNAITDKIPEKFFPAYSTHAFSITEAVGLAVSIGLLPKHLLVYGVEGKNFETGSEISDKVKTAIDKVTGLILIDIAYFGPNSLK